MNRLGIKPSNWHPIYRTNKLGDLVERLEKKDPKLEQRKLLDNWKTLNVNQRRSR